MSMPTRASVFGALLADYFPGALAATHDLRATDGRRYTFGGDLRGLWWRSIDPGCTDYHVWAPEGLYYLGWSCPGQLHWMAPPMLTIPRTWDPDVPTTLRATYAMVSRTAAGVDRLTTAEISGTLSAGVQQGEWLIYMGGAAVPSDGSVEHWWMSACIPVLGGGCAPGIRGYVITDAAGAVTVSGEFVQWVPR